MDENLLKELVADIKSIKAAVEDIPNIKAMINETNVKFDTLTEEVGKLKLENNELKDKMNVLSQENHELKHAVYSLEQYSRKNNAIITGVPPAEKENTRELVKKIAGVLQIKISDYDIAAAHRLPAKGGKIPAIIVKLNNNDTKTALVKNSKAKKLTCANLGWEEESPIFVSDHLTTYNAILLSKARQLKFSGIISHAWCREGKIFIRVNDNDRATIITDISQLTVFEHLPPNSKNQYDEEIESEERATTRKPEEIPTERCLRTRPQSQSKQQAITQYTANSQSNSRTKIQKRK